MVLDAARQDRVAPTPAGEKDKTASPLEEPPREDGEMADGLEAPERCVEGRQALGREDIVGNLAFRPSLF